MKEKDIQNLIKESVKSPSENFTDNLLDQIAIQEKKAFKINWRLITLFVSCIPIFILSFFITIPEIHYLGYSIHLSSLIVPVFSIFFILYELAQLLEIQQRILKYNNSKPAQQGN